MSDVSTELIQQCLEQVDISGMDEFKDSEWKYYRICLCHCMALLRVLLARMSDTLDSKVVLPVYQQCLLQFPLSIYTTGITRDQQSKMSFHSDADTIEMYNAIYSTDVQILGNMKSVYSLDNMQFQLWMSPTSTELAMQCIQFLATLLPGIEWQREYIQAQKQQYQYIYGEQRYIEINYFALLVPALEALFPVLLQPSLQQIQAHYNEAGYIYTLSALSSAKIEGVKRDTETFSSSRSISVYSPDLETHLAYGKCIQFPPAKPDLNNGTTSLQPGWTLCPMMNFFFVSFLTQNQAFVMKNSSSLVATLVLQTCVKQLSISDARQKCLGIFCISNILAYLKNGVLPSNTPACVVQCTKEHRFPLDINSKGIYTQLLPQLVDPLKNVVYIRDNTVQYALTLESIYNLVQLAPEFHPVFQTHLFDQVKFICGSSDDLEDPDRQFLLLDRGDLFQSTRQTTPQQCKCIKCTPISSNHPSYIFSAAYTGVLVTVLELTSYLGKVEYKHETVPILACKLDNSRNQLKFLNSMLVQSDVGMVLNRYLSILGDYSAHTDPYIQLVCLRCYKEQMERQEYTMYNHDLFEVVFKKLLGMYLRTYESVYITTFASRVFAQSGYFGDDVVVELDLVNSVKSASYDFNSEEQSALEQDGVPKEVLLALQLDKPQPDRTKVVRTITAYFAYIRSCVAQLLAQCISSSGEELESPWKVLYSPYLPYVQAMTVSDWVVNQTSVFDVEFLYHEYFFILAYKNNAEYTVVTAENAISSDPVYVLVCSTIHPSDITLNTHTYIHNASASIVEFETLLKHLFFLLGFNTTPQ